MDCRFRIDSSFSAIPRTHRIRGKLVQGTLRNGDWILLPLTDGSSVKKRVLDLTRDGSAIEEVTVTQDSVTFDVIDDLRELAGMIGTGTVATCTDPSV